ncbi:MAG: hypothetical protein HQ583_01870 [Candidatus Abyssubacteria bacterium]|nr:hypothetical protein [Candidatus Abyssubacteria bacterium]
MFYSVFAPLVFLMLMGLVAGAVVLLVYLLNLARDVKELRRRLSGLEAFIAAGPESVHRPEHPQVPPQPSRLARPPAPPPPPPPTVPPATAPKKPEWNLEALIGGKWLNRIGVVLVIFGVAFS